VGNVEPKSGRQCYAPAVGGSADPDDRSLRSPLPRQAPGAYTRPLFGSTLHAFCGTRVKLYVEYEYPKAVQVERKSGRVACPRQALDFNIDIRDGLKPLPRAWKTLLLLATSSTRIVKSRFLTGRFRYIAEVEWTCRVADKTSALRAGKRAPD